MGLSQIGEAFIRLSVKGKDEVKKAFVEVRQTAETAVGGVRGVVNRLGPALDKSTEGARKLQGALTGIVGTVAGVAALSLALGTGLTKAVLSVVDALTGGKKAAEDFIAALDPQTEVTGRLAALRSELNEITAVIGNASTAVSKNFTALNTTGLTYNQLLEKQAALQSEADKLAGQIAAQRLRRIEREQAAEADAARERERAEADRAATEQAASDERIRRAQREREQIRSALFDDERGQAASDAQTRLADLEAQYREAVARGEQALANTYANIAQLEQERFRQRIANIEAEERRQREEQARTAAERLKQIEAERKAVQDLSRAIEDALNVRGTGIFGASSIDDLTQAINGLGLRPRPGRLL